MHNLWRCAALGLLAATPGEAQLGIWQLGAAA